MKYILMLMLLVSHVFAMEVLPEGGWWPCHKGLHLECQKTDACSPPNGPSRFIDKCDDPIKGCTIKYEHSKDDWRTRKCFVRGNDIYLDKFAENSNNWVHQCDVKLHPECAPETVCNSPTNPNYPGCKECANKYCGCTLDFVTSHDAKGNPKTEKRLCYRTGKGLLLGVYTKLPD